MDHHKETEAARYGKLLAKALSGTLTGAEQAAFDAWLADDDRRALYDGLRRGDRLAGELARFARYDAEQVYDLFQQKRDVMPPTRRRSMRWLPYAAAVLLVASAVGWWAISHQPAADYIAATEILPGGNKATLTLADGRTIDLSSDQEGIVIGAEDITYQDGVSLGLSPVGGGRDGRGRLDDDIEELSLSTPKGGTYQVTLPDGTKVWLNAASTLRYPSRFVGDERNVEISGEAYFSVFTDKSKPFKVTSHGQTVEVVGTEFNISAYPDESETKTTLVQGKVRVGLSLAGESVPTGREGRHGSTDGRGRSLELKPGQQAINRGTSITVSAVDVFDYTAWRDGMIVLSGAHLSDVVRQVERWYDVTIEFSEIDTDNTAYVMINRSENLSSVLKALEETYHVKFKLEGRRVSVIE